MDKVTQKDQIYLEKQPDGNWKGWRHTGTKVVDARQGDPGTVLTMLITHD